MRAYLDNTGCCDGLKDYSQCKEKATCKKLDVLYDKQGKPLSKAILIKGTRCFVKSNDRYRRRKLMRNSNGGESF